MLYDIINKQLFEIAKRNNLNYSCNLSCFNLENENGYRLSVLLMIGGKYSLIIKINGYKKHLVASDCFTLFLLSNFMHNLNNHSFVDALKEMCHLHEKIQETIKELKNNENSTN